MENILKFIKNFFLNQNFVGVALLVLVTLVTISSSQEAKQTKKVIVNTAALTTVNAVNDKVNSDNIVSNTTSINDLKKEVEAQKSYTPNPVIVVKPVIVQTVAKPVPPREYAKPTPAELAAAGKPHKPPLSDRLKYLFQ